MRLRCYFGFHRWRVESVGLLRTDRCDWCRRARWKAGTWDE